MAKPKGIKSLSESVDASEIVITDEEIDAWDETEVFLG